MDEPPTHHVVPSHHRLHVPKVNLVQQEKQDWEACGLCSHCGGSHRGAGLSPSQQDLAGRQGAETWNMVSIQLCLEVTSAEMLLLMEPG